MFDAGQLYAVQSAVMRFGALIYAYQGLFIASLLFVLVLAVLYALRRFALQSVESHATVMGSKLSIPVSIVAAALNEEKVILPAVQSLLAQNYPEFEVILVDDGSTDGTIALLREAYDLAPLDIRVNPALPAGPVVALYRSRRDPRLTVVSKQNRKSKADALNCGINFAHYRYLCCVDGDTIYGPEALLDGMSIVQKNPSEVVGVTSYFGISRTPEASVGVDGYRLVDRHWLSMLQNLDLMRSFLVNRLAFSEIGAMMCNPGAFAIWRKDLFAEIGGYDPSFSCEDIEFTYRVHEHFRRLRRRYQIAALPKLIAMTEGPDNIGALVKQRARWQRVLMETVWAYRRMTLNPRYGTVGLVAMPYNLVFEAISPVVQLLSIVAVAALALLGAIDSRQLLLLLVAVELITSAPSLLAILIDNRQHRDYRLRDILLLGAYSLLDFFLFKPIILLAGLKGSIDFLKGRKGWDKFERNDRRKKRGPWSGPERRSGKERRNRPR